MEQERQRDQPDLDEGQVVEPRQRTDDLLVEVLCTEARPAVLPQVKRQECAHRHHAEQRVQTSEHEVRVGDGSHASTREYGALSRRAMPGAGQADRGCGMAAATCPVPPRYLASIAVTLRVAVTRLSASVYS
jgi:hypothetical protein